jgi:hypothetical protein
MDVSTVRHLTNLAFDCGLPQLHSHPSQSLSRNLSATGPNFVKTTMLVKIVVCSATISLTPYVR